MSDAARAWARRLGPIGLWMHDLERLTATAARDLVRTVESLGFPAIWIPESLGSKEIFAHASLLLSATEKLIVASGIANIWARDPVAMANGARALVDAYPDRFLLGIGVSHAPTVTARGQHTYGRPLDYMKRYLDAMEVAPYVGPKVEVPKVLAALGPQMLTLAAERTFGAHSYFVPVEHTSLARKTLGDGPLLVVEQAAVLSEDAAVSRQAARRHMKRYLELDNYTNNLRRLGWSEELANGGSDRLVDAIVAWGDSKAVRARLDEHRRRGADHVCLQMLRADPAAPPTRDLETIAKAFSL